MNYFTVDGHADTIYNLDSRKDFDFMKENSTGHLDYPRLIKGGVNLQVMALFTQSKYKPYQALPRTTELFGLTHNILQQNPTKITLVQSKTDLKNLYEKQNRLGFLIGLEGAEACTSILKLKAFFAMGLRLIGLTWNQRNQLADGVGEENSKGGLTTLGRAVVEEAERLGIIIDVAHLSPQGFWDIVNLSKKPFVASHSNAFSIRDHKRNLTDEQITALAEVQGLLGINFSPAFLTKNWPATIDDVLAHIDYIVKKWGSEYVGLGSDFDGISATPEGLEDVSKFPQLAHALQRKYNEKTVENIMGLNWKRVMLEILPDA